MWSMALITSRMLASGSDPTNARQKMAELRQNQKADVVLKQEVGLYRRLHGPEYPQLRVVEFSRNNVCAHVGVLRNVTGLRIT